jgi:hypothetical protein
MSNNTTQEKSLFYFNGIDGATGKYGIPPMTGEELSKYILEEVEPENLGELEFRKEMREQGTFGVKYGVNPAKLSETGWGIIFAHDADPAVKEALSELIQLRKEQAGDYFKIYEGPNAYWPEESKNDFLARHKVGPGPADPEKMPYYLLIVGSPEAIPYPFQYQLDVQYSVGRIYFNTPEEYANYAKSVKEAETKKIKLPREISFFSTANKGDQPTLMSTESLITPLYEKLIKEKTDWKIKAYLKDKATRDQLARLLGGDETPSLLFTASHGMEFVKGHPQQIPHQGALICQDWPGLKEWGEKGPVTQDFYFAGDDIMDSAKLHGLLTFHFACYSAGTPLNDEFSRQMHKEIAPHPFLAGLPTRLLGHPRGGALAVIGHVERAWSYSFRWPKAGDQTTVFEAAIDSLLAGNPIGHAIEYFNERYSELSTMLAEERKAIKIANKKFDSYALSHMWTANNDARSYVILGDPAVRLPVAEPGESPIERKALVLNTISEKKSETPQKQPLKPVTPGEKEPIIPVDEAAVNFGLLDMGQGLAGTLKDVSQKLADLLVTTVNDLTSLEVQTYTTDDLRGITYDKKTGKFSEKARLQALTRIALDGDMLNLIPQEKKSAVQGSQVQTSTEIDDRLWTIHREMVEMAQTNRVQFVKALAEVAASMLKIVK